MLVVENKKMNSQEVLSLLYEQEQRYSNCDLQSKTVRFRNCDLQCAMFNSKHLANLAFINCNLKNVQFENCIFKNVHFNECNLRNVRFSRCTHDFVTIIDSDAGHVNFITTDINQCQFGRNNFSMSSWIGCWIGQSSICNCDLQSSNLTNCRLHNIDIGGTNLCGAHLTENQMCNIKATSKTTGYYMRCPKEGSFIGYKCTLNCIVKLQIPARARRSSATTNKCRCSQAKVLGFYDFEGNKLPEITKASSYYDSAFLYQLGKTVTSKFDPDRWKECSDGIHFFMSFEEAVDYHRLLV